MEIDETKDITDRNQLVEKMREHNCTQLKTLCRMHLSFEIDLELDNENNTDRVKHKLWTKFHKKTKSCTATGSSPVSFQPGLEQLHKLIRYLHKEDNITQEGIFRKTGSVARQNELRAALVENYELDLHEGLYTVHDCASTLKTILSELEEPLFTCCYYSAFQQVAGKVFFAQNQIRLKWVSMHKLL